MSACPCCSGLDYAVCCQPFHQGTALPPTAEALMRSRYAAFARKQVDYLVATLHPQHTDHQGGEAVKRSLKKMCNRCTFPKLTILLTTPEDPQGRATVTFDAVLLEGARDVGFVERSVFERVDGGWRYVSGQMLPRQTADPNVPTR